MSGVGLLVLGLLGYCSRSGDEIIKWVRLSEIHFYLILLAAISKPEQLCSLCVEPVWISSDV